MTDGYRAVGPQLAATPGAEVLVVGGAAASIGLYAVAAAIACGAGRVRYADSDTARCAAATVTRRDVTRSTAWPRRLDRAPIVVVHTGDVDGLASTLRSTDDFGTCTSVAIHFAPTTPMPLLELYTKGITSHLRARTHPLAARGHRLAASGALDPLAVPTTIVPWDQADDAWLEPATKLVLERA